MKYIFILFLLGITVSFAQSPKLIIPSGHSNSILEVSESADGRILATSSSDKTVKVYLKSSMQELFTFDVGYDPRMVRVSPNGRYVVGATTTQMKVADVNTGKVVKTFENRQGCGIAFHPTKPEFYITTYIGGSIYMEVKKFDLNTMNVVSLCRSPKPLPEKDHFVEYTLELSNDGNWLYMSTNDYLVNLSSKTFKRIEGTLMIPDGRIFGYIKKDDKYVIFLKDMNGNLLWEKNVPELKESWYNVNNSIVAVGDKLYINFSKSGVMECALSDGSYTIKKLPEEITSSLLRASNDKTLLTANIKGELFGLDKNTLQITDRYTMPSPYPAIHLAGAFGTNAIAMGTRYPYKEPIKLLRLGKQGVSISSSDKPVQVWSLGLSNDASTLGIGFDYNWTITKTNSIITTGIKSSPVGTPSTIGFNNDGSKYFLQAPDGYSLFNENSTVPTKTVNKPYNYYHYENQVADVSEDGKNFVGYFIDKPSKDAPNIEQLIAYDAATGTVKWRASGQYLAVRYAQNDASVVAVKRKPVAIETYNANTGNVMSTYAITTTGDNDRAAISNTGQFVAVAGKELQIFDVANQKLYTNRQLKSSVRNMTYFGDDFLMTVENDQLLRLYDGRTAKLLATVVVFLNDEWAVVTEDGYFDASKGAMATMYYRVGNNTVKLEQFYESFFTPGLLGQLLSREYTPPSPIVIDNVSTPPVVRISYKEGTRNLVVEDDAPKEIITQNDKAILTLQATSSGSQVAEIRLYHNGKRISQNNRNLVVEDDVSANNLSKTFEVTLLPGENTFEAIAMNTQRTESSPAKLSISLQQNNAVPTPDKLKGLNLHLIVVGIDAYKNPKYNLNYAVADATSFKTEIEKGVKKITSSQQVTFIKNSDAQRDAIKAAFDKVAKTANPQDIFVFYYAGHGVMSEGEAKDFYLVPHDVTQLYGNDGGLKKQGISATELKMYAAGIPAQKQLYILDACQSAGALSTVAMRGAAEEKAIAQLARSTGTHWLTASGSEQFATEFDELGHGVFTYALLEALSGKADSGDKRVTVNEIKAYIESRVPEISAKYKGSPQYPSSFGFGQDFPVSISNQ